MEQFPYDDTRMTLFTAVRADGWPSLLSDLADVAEILARDEYVSADDRRQAEALRGPLASVARLALEGQEAL